MNNRRKFVLIALSMPAALMLAIVFVFHGSQQEYSQWILPVTVTSILWLGFVVIFSSINKQVDENPYYTEMVIKKRDEVRLRQKMHAKSQKG